MRVDHNFGDVRFFSRYGHNGRHEDRANNGRQDIAVTNDGHHYRWNDNLNGDLTWSIGPVDGVEPEGWLDAARARGT